MSSPGRLVGCGGCRRHVRIGEVGDARCPFCGADVPRPPPVAVGWQPGSTVARAVVLAGALAACNTTTPSMVPAYGGPPWPGEPDDGAAPPLAQLDGGDDGSSAAISPLPSANPVGPNVAAPAYGGPPPFLQAPPLAPDPDAGARKKHTP